MTVHEHRLRIPTDTSFPSGHAASFGLLARRVGQPPLLSDDGG